MISNVAEGCGRCRAQPVEKLEFTFAYQPIVDVRSRSIYAHEALVRGIKGESAHSVLSRVTEENRYPFDQMCRARAIDGAANLGMPERLCINFLPNAVYTPKTCIQGTFRAAKARGFPIEQLIFEVTEGEQVEDRAHLVNIFREYKSLGLGTAIDDFGAGYSGLTLLSDFQPDIVKLDMHLIRGVDADPIKAAIVECVVTMCGKLGPRVLAEGVETREEMNFLFGAGVDLMQGYFFARPAFEGMVAIDSASWPSSAC